MKCIQLASYTYLDRQIKYLKEQIELATASQMGNHIETGQIARPTEPNIGPNNSDNDHRILFHDNHYSQQPQPFQNTQNCWPDNSNPTAIASHQTSNKMDQEGDLIQF